MYVRYGIGRCFPNILAPANRQSSAKSAALRVKSMKLDYRRVRSPTILNVKMAPEREPELSEIPKSQRKFQSYIPSDTNKRGWREELKYYDFKIPKWKYGFADSIRVICGLVPKQQEKYEPFDPFDPKSYKVENCHRRLHDYQRMLDERGWKDPWIRTEVPNLHKINTTRVYTAWQMYGRMLVPGIILGIICAKIKVKYFTYHDYEGREEKWKHFEYAKHH